MSINCPHCFTPNAEGAKFCKLCGNSLQAATTSVAAPAAAPAQDLDFMLDTMGPTVLPQPVAPPGKPPVTPAAPTGADPIVFDSFVAPPPINLPPNLPDVEDPNATVVSWVKPVKVPAAAPPFTSIISGQSTGFDPGMSGAGGAAGAGAAPLFSTPAPDTASAPQRTPAEVREALFPSAAPAPSTRGSGFGLIAGIAIAGVIAVAGAGYWFLAASDKKPPAAAVQPPTEASPPPALTTAPAPGAEAVASPPAPVLAAPAPTETPAVNAMADTGVTAQQPVASSPAEVAAKAAAASATRARQAARLAATEKARAEAGMKKEAAPVAAPAAPVSPPVVAAPAAPAPAPAPVAVRAPRDVCGDKLLGDFVQCMDQQCRASSHSQCAAFKRQQRENEKARNPDAY